jgi:hypothetical protein
MPAATKPKPTRTSKLPARIAALAAELREEALADWRAWAQQIADGGDAPAAREVIEAARILKVDNPASQLQADADAIGELASYSRAAALCRQSVADKLVPYAGNIETLRAKAESLRAESDRLLAELELVSSGCSEPYWTSASHHLKRRHPLLWPELQPQRAEQPEYLSDEEPSNET